MRQTSAVRPAANKAALAFVRPAAGYGGGGGILENDPAMGRVAIIAALARPE